MNSGRTHLRAGGYGPTPLRYTYSSSLMLLYKIIFQIPAYFQDTLPSVIKYVSSIFIVARNWIFSNKIDLHQAQHGPYHHYVGADQCNQIWQICCHFGQVLKVFGNLV